MIWGFKEVAFLMQRPETFSEIDFSLPRLISPSTISFLVAKTFFFIPNTCVLLFYESFFWYELLGVEEAQNWIDKPS